MLRSSKSLFYRAISLICITTSVSGVSLRAQQQTGELVVDDTAELEYAKVYRTTVDEARRRLAIMRSAARVGEKLKKIAPDQFGEVQFIHGPTTKLRILFKAGKLKSMREVVAAELTTAGSPATEEVIVKRSDRENRTLVSDLVSDFARRGLIVTIASNLETGKIVILTSDVDAAKVIVRDITRIPQSDLSVERFSGINPTAQTTSWTGGTAINNFGGGGDCTTGFNVVGIAGAGLNVGKTGVTSAAHCAGPNPVFEQVAYLDAFGNPFCCLSSVFATMGLVQRIPASGLDVAWYRFANPSNNSIKKTVYNGTNNVTVTTTMSPFTNQFVCKYGRTTRRTCGNVDANLYADALGTFRRVNSNSTYPTMTLGGDSGGPVFDGGAAIGLVRGKDDSGNMYFGSVVEWLGKGFTAAIVLGP